MPQSLDNGFRLTLDSGKGQQSVSKGRKDADQITRLIDLIGNEQFSIRVAATKELIETGPPAIPALLDALQGGLWFTRECAARALGRIGGDEVIEPLLERLQDENVGVRQSTLEALALMVERDGPEQVGEVIAGLEPGRAIGIFNLLRRTNPLTARRLDEYLSDHHGGPPRKEKRAEPEARRQPAEKDAARDGGDQGFRSLWSRIRQYLGPRS
jgi:hypothetical protein